MYSCGLQEALNSIEEYDCLSECTPFDLLSSSVKITNERFDLDPNYKVDRCWRVDPIEGHNEVSTV